MTCDLKLYFFGTPSAATLSAGTASAATVSAGHHLMISLKCLGQIKPFTKCQALNKLMNPLSGNSWVNLTIAPYRSGFFMRLLRWIIKRRLNHLKFCNRAHIGVVRWLLIKL